MTHEISELRNLLEDQQKNFLQTLDLNFSPLEAVHFDGPFQFVKILPKLILIKFKNFVRRYNNRRNRPILKTILEMQKLTYFTHKKIEQILICQEEKIEKLTQEHTQKEKNQFNSY